MKISEDNIEQYINDRRSEMSLPDIYFALKKQVTKQINGERFNSLQSNYTPIFLYFAIQGKCSLSDFEKLLQFSPHYEEGLIRFFNRADCSYEQSKTSHIYNKMSYLFYEPIDDKIIFDKEKIPYIKEIIKNVRLKNLLEFHSSRIDSFLAHIIMKDQAVGQDIIESIVSSPFMWIEEHGQYPNMIKSLINIFAHENYSTDISSVYNLFKENTFFYKELQTYLISETLDNKKYKINLSIYKMMLDNEDNYFPIVENRLKELKEKLSEKDYIHLIDDSVYAFESGLKEKPVMLDLKKINSNNKIADNLPYLVMLKQLIQTGQYSYITGESKFCKDYIKQQQEKINDVDKNSSISYQEYFLIKQIDFETIEKFLNFKYLDDKYSLKEQKIQKNKI